MRVGHLQVTRPEWYDRHANPVTKSAAATGPVGVTQLWTYTVPSGKKAYCDLVLSTAYRGQIATATGIVQCLVDYAAVSGGGAALLTDIRMDANINGASERQLVGQFGIVVAGDIFTATVVDPCTGGSTTLRCTLKATEYDY